MFHFWPGCHTLLWRLALCEGGPTGNCCLLLPAAFAHWSCCLFFTHQSTFPLFSPLSLIFTRSQSMARVKLCHINWPLRPVKAIFDNALVLIWQKRGRHLLSWFLFLIKPLLMVMDWWEVCRRLTVPWGVRCCRWKADRVGLRPWPCWRCLLHVVFASGPSGVLQTLWARQKFQTPALLSFSPTTSEVHLASDLVEKWEG